MAPKRKSTPSRNPLRSGASTSSDPTPSHVRFRDEKAKSDLFENFSQRGIRSKCRVILLDFFDTDLSTVIHSRGWESLCDILVTYPSLLIQEFSSNMHGFDFSILLSVTRVRGTRIVVTLDILFDMFCVPRVEYLDYPSCDHLKTMFKDELISSFCERSSNWGYRHFTYCLGFAKGPRFLNMVMTFVLHHLS